MSDKDDFEKAMDATDLAVKAAPALVQIMGAFFDGLAKLHVAIHGNAKPQEPAK